MRLSEHLNKGVWALADRGLPFIYAIALFALARVLGPAAYGTYAVFQGIFNMLFTFTDNFALQAIVKYGVEPDTDLEALVTATSTLFLGFLLPILLLFNLLAGAVASMLGNQDLASLFPLLALYVVVSAPRVVFSKVLQMRFRMKEIFFVDLANFGVGGALLGTGLLLHRIQYPAQAIWIMVFAAMLSSIVSAWFVRKYVRPRFVYSSAMFARIKQFVRYQGATGLVSVLQQNLDTLAVSSFTGAAGAGIYAVAKNVYRVYDVMRDTVTLLVFPATSKYYSRGELGTVRKILEKSVGFLYLVVIPISVALFVAAPFIYHAIFAAKFNGSIVVLRILITGSLVLPIQMVFISTMVGMGKVKDMFRIITVGLSLNIALMFVLLPTIGIQGAAIAFVVGNAVQAALAYRFIKREIGFGSVDVIGKAWADASSFLQVRLNQKKTRDRGSLKG